MEMVFEVEEKKVVEGDEMELMLELPCKAPSLVVSIITYQEVLG
jgi:hypothetical protein